MEIRSPGFNGIQKNTEITKKIKKSKAPNFTDAMDEPSSTPIHQSTAIFSIDPIFTDLNEPSPEQKGIQKGLSLLDELEKLRSQLLSGHIDSESIKTIQTYAKQINTDNLDDRLKELLLQIETRAVVELAKYRRSTQ